MDQLSEQLFFIVPVAVQDAIDVWQSIRVVLLVKGDKPFAHVGGGHVVDANPA
jgi:hypothetical protein